MHWRNILVVRRGLARRFLIRFQPRLGELGVGWGCEAQEHRSCTQPAWGPPCECVNCRGGAEASVTPGPVTGVPLRPPICVRFSGQGREGGGHHLCPVIPQRFPASRRRSALSDAHPVVVATWCHLRGAVFVVAHEVSRVTVDQKLSWKPCISLKHGL